jgi:hypothetical protein
MVQARLVTESAFHTNFPTSRLEGLRLRVPPVYAGTPWTAVQAVEATLAIDSFKGSHVRFNQLQDLSWVDGVVLETAARRLCSILPSTGVRFEQPCDVLFDRVVAYDGGFRSCKGIRGFMDAFHADTTTVYECKLSREKLEDKHKQQLLLYLHLLVCSAQGEHACVRGVLFNASTHERWYVEVPRDKERSRAFLARVVGKTLRTEETVVFPQ